MQLGMVGPVFQIFRTLGGEVSLSWCPLTLIPGKRELYRFTGKSRVACASTSRSLYPHSPCVAPTHATTRLEMRWRGGGGISRPSPCKWGGSTRLGTGKDGRTKGRRVDWQFVTPISTFWRNYFGLDAYDNARERSLANAITESMYGGSPRYRGMSYFCLKLSVS